MNRVVVGVGSNIDPEKNIEEARKRIEKRHRVVAESRFIRTKPVGYSEQPDFVNGVIRIETEMEYGELNEWLGGVESDLGRVRGGNRYGPRTMDLDVVVWNGEIVDKDVCERGFLRNCILEVWPDLVM